MKFLVVGSGGREHALAWKLRQQRPSAKIFVAPGNAGTAQLASNVPIDVLAIDELAAFACEQKIDLTVVGPDASLANGIVDQFASAGLRIFGPKQQAAQLESSKSFCKDFLIRHGIPTARATVHEELNEAERELDHRSYPVVVKADGLAFGKGVIVAADREAASRAVHSMIQDRKFGTAGRRVLIEDFVSGHECSIHALIDGRGYLLLPTAQDHKALYDGNLGPNTGGMGAVSPSPHLTTKQMEEIEEQVLEPFVRGLRLDRIDFRGLFFPGLMMSEDGLKVLEINCRFGDPECQALMPRLDSDFVEMLDATISGELHRISPRWSPDPTAAVIMAAPGYPEMPELGYPISGLEAVANELGLMVFHAGTRTVEGRVVTSGGRVLCVTASGSSLSAARDKAYEAVQKIEFEGCYFRRDIGRF